MVAGASIWNGTMQPTTPRDFLEVARQRLDAAEQIMDKLRLTLEAQYIGGYSVECSFKALILEKTLRAGRRTVAGSGPGAAVASQGASWH